MTWKDIFHAAFQHNPGVLTTALSAFLLPVLILLLKNRHQRELKRLEKELARSSDSDTLTERQEDLVYGPLVKILFGVQRLYTELSKPSCDPSCLSQAVGKFKLDIVQYQSVIADNQLKLAPKLIEDIYRFYAKISELEIRVDELSAQGRAILVACVATLAQEMADVLIDYQRAVMKKRDFLLNFDEEKFASFRGCCGGPVDKEAIAAFLEWRERANKAPEPTPGSVTLRATEGVSK
jgi:hypothetical protein